MMEEMLDVIDADDNVIGRTTREECHKKLFRHRAIQVFVFDTTGRVFVQKRTKTKDAFPSLYEASISGHVKAGETYKNAAERELAEELGITHKKHELHELFSFKLRAKPEHEIIAQYSLQCECVGRLQKEEVESGEFLSWKEFVEQAQKKPKKFTPACIAALQLYLEKYATARQPSFVGTHGG
jgi:isopentenyl-diphosphate delta-isomerase type 1